jgi:transcriptional regulator with XRE-family HTH domain
MTKMNSVIKILREQNHYTQTKLAEDLKISRQALIKYENMELEPPVSVVRALSNIFGVSYDCIIDNHLPLELDDADKERLSVIEHSFPKLKEHEKMAVTEMARIMAKGEE